MTDRPTYISFAESVENQLEDEKAEEFSEEHEACLNKRMIEGTRLATISTYALNLVGPSKLLFFVYFHSLRNSSHLLCCERV